MGKNMKIVILAGGFGTRLSELTDIIPKPMVTIGGIPIIEHIMNYYFQFGYKDFYIALGYKSEKIKEYFLNYPVLNSDFSINMSDGKITTINKVHHDWKVTLVDTGKDTMTGGRLKRMKKYIGEETFMMTYGDGLSNININELVKFHKKNNKIATISAVHPTARFGELEIKNNIVEKFTEKSQLNTGWINGGFFIFESKIFDLINNDQTMLEREPLETLAKQEQLMAFKHEGFWHCMDTKRDKDLLEDIWIEGPPWSSK
jgi:glucose-1-phosphate cytidylyltransferase